MANKKINVKTLNENILALVIELYIQKQPIEVLCKIYVLQLCQEAKIRLNARRLNYFEGKLSGCNSDCFNCLSEFFF